MQNQYTKSVAFLYTNNELVRRKTKKAISFKIVAKRIKNLGTNLTKEVNNIHTENYKIGWKKLKTTQRNGKTVCADGLEEIILWKCLHYPKQYTYSMQSPSKSQGHYTQN